MSHYGAVIRELIEHAIEHERDATLRICCGFAEEHEVVNSIWDLTFPERLVSTPRHNTLRCLKLQKSRAVRPSGDIEKAPSEPSHHDSAAA